MQISGLGTTFNLPNYAGELFTADMTQAPLFTMAGGLTGGRETNSVDFPTSILYDFPSPKQPEISEQGSATAPTASAIAKSVQKNVVQIHQEVIELSYLKQSSYIKLPDDPKSIHVSPAEDEKSWQISQRLVKIARDIEYSFINGSYKLAASASVANKTRGMIEACGGGNVINSEGNLLTKDLLADIFREMAKNGAYFSNIVIFANAFQKQMITEIYASANLIASERKNVGGVNITALETDFCLAGVVWNRFMPTDMILIADMAYVAPVFQPVPGKGNFFEEELAKVGASDRIQIYGQVGLAHGPSFLHGLIMGLKTSKD